MEDDMCTPVGGMIYCASDTGSEFYARIIEFCYKILNEQVSETRLVTIN